ncbi:MAG TPA: NADH-quinone oxidoreductase subunit L [Candidatus Deferrimicrobiaceae bacterium]|nr:NADH-quinone oxidoreductase subunit L [Candidatus Deferrimicrobiaceae bacterium]
MIRWLWLIPALPFASALVLMLFGSRFSRKAIAALGVGSIGLSALITILVAIDFFASPPAGGAYTQLLWTWISVAGFTPQIGFYLDALSLVMVLVVTFVGFLIHIYSAEFMIEDEGYSRFFAYMNLFVASMLTLLLANNLLLLYLGWEGVGLCSYLLIGFWYRDPANGRAARKAFIATRVGDTAMSVGLFLLFTQLGTLEIQDLMHRASEQWPSGSTYAVIAALLLLGGAVGKSAQLPLQVWLPDAMAGPTPTSALLHAATMVTAGVYLIARTHVLFSLAPTAQFTVAIVGASTMLLAGFSALTQYDIKRVLAYSTVSQIGYMFLALGVGAWQAAIFHFVTHACFKALLFLGAGVIINALDDEHSIFKMGGLREELPVAFWTFLIAGCSLAGLPLITAGFFSKDLIIWEAWSAQQGHPALWIAGMIGALLTSLYIFRVIFRVFFGPLGIPVTKRPGYAMTIPLLVLAFFSIVAGYLKVPLLGFLSSALPATIESHTGGLTEIGSEAVAALLFAIGLYFAYLFHLQKRSLADALMANPVARVLHEWWFADWGFDWIYDKAFVQPYIWAAQVNKTDFIDTFYTGVAWLTQLFYRGLSRTETGRVRWYAAAMAAGSVLFVAMVLFK